MQEEKEKEDQDQDQEEEEEQKQQEGGAEAGKQLSWLPNSTYA